MRPIFFYFFVRRPLGRSRGDHAASSATVRRQARGDKLARVQLDRPFGRCRRESIPVRGGRGATPSPRPPPRRPAVARGRLARAARGRAAASARRGALPACAGRRSRRRRCARSVPAAPSRRVGGEAAGATGGNRRAPGCERHRGGPSSRRERHYGRASMGESVPPRRHQTRTDTAGGARLVSGVRRHHARWRGRQAKSRRPRDRDLPAATFGHTLRPPASKLASPPPPTPSGSQSPTCAVLPPPKVKEPITYRPHRVDRVRRRGVARRGGRRRRRVDSDGGRGEHCRRRDGSDEGGEWRRRWRGSTFDG